MLLLIYFLNIPMSNIMEQIVSIFQKSVINKYLKNLDKAKLDKAFGNYKDTFTAEKIEIIKSVKEEEYQEAQQDYEEYDQDFQETSKQELFKVTEAEQQVLKATFRACSKICHPDVVAQGFKAEASQLFARLCEANGKNDIPAVKAIYEQLQKGIFAPMSATVSDAQKLHGQVVRIRGKVKDLAVAISALRTTDAYRKVVAIEDWDEYFTKLKQQLQAELESLEAVVE